MSKKPVAAPAADDEPQPPRYADINKRSGVEHRIIGAMEKLRGLASDDPRHKKAMDHMQQALDLCAIVEDEKNG